MRFGDNGFQFIRVERSRVMVDIRVAGLFEHLYSVFMDTFEQDDLDLVLLQRKFAVHGAPSFS